MAKKRTNIPHGTPGAFRVSWCGGSKTVASLKEATKLARGKATEKYSLIGAGRCHAESSVLKWDGRRKGKFVLFCSNRVCKRATGIIYR